MTQNNNNCKHFALIDLGSSALRADVFSCNYPESSNIFLINKFRYLPRLGSLEQGNIKPAGIQEVRKILAQVKHELGNFKNLHIHAFGTAVFRDANNAPDAIELFSEVLGSQFHVPDGKTEALLIYRGISAFEKEMPRPSILIDIGGRSSEISFIGLENSESSLVSCSIPLGALNTYEKFFAASENNISPPYNFDLVQSEITRSLDLPKNLPEMKFHTITGSSGTLKALKYLYNRTNDSMGRASDHIPIEFLFKLLDTLQRSSKDQTSAILHDESHRYDLIIGGMNLLKAYVDLFETSSIFVTPYSARHGALLQLVKKAYPDLTDPDLNSFELHLESTEELKGPEYPRS